MQLKSMLSSAFDNCQLMLVVAFIFYLFDGKSDATAVAYSKTGGEMMFKCVRDKVLDASNGAVTPENIGTETTGTSLLQCARLCHSTVTPDDCVSFNFDSANDKCILFKTTFPNDHQIAGVAGDAYCYAST